MKKQQFLQAILIAVVAMVVTSCAPVQPNLQTCLVGDTYGFWGGIWHGCIAPIAFVISWFDSDVAVYAVNNNGGWYTFGFLLGVGAFSRGTYQVSR